MDREFFEQLARRAREKLTALYEQEKGETPQACAFRRALNRLRTLHQFDQRSDRIADEFEKLRADVLADFLVGFGVAERR